MSKTGVSYFFGTCEENWANFIPSLVTLDSRAREIINFDVTEATI